LIAKTASPGRLSAAAFPAPATRTSSTTAAPIAGRSSPTWKRDHVVSRFASTPGACVMSCERSARLNASRGSGRGSMSLI
jgi:hypothetical protein